MVRVRIYEDQIHSLLSGASNLGSLHMTASIVSRVLTPLETITCFKMKILEVDPISQFIQKHVRFPALEAASIRTGRCSFIEALVSWNVEHLDLWSDLRVTESMLHDLPILDSVQSIALKELMPRVTT